MQGPDMLGDEFDEVEEDEKADPNVVYDVLDVDLPAVVRITSLAGDDLRLQVDGDDVIFSMRMEGAEVAHTMRVARSALVEALADIGMLGNRRD